MKEKKIAEILINENVNKLNKTFDYMVPKNLKDKINLGSRVEVVFNSRKTDGFVLNFKEESEFKKLNNVLEIIAESELNKDRIDLARYISSKYFASLASCIKLLLDPGKVGKNILNKKMENAYSLNDDVKTLVLKNIDKDFLDIKNIIKENLDINITERHLDVIVYFIENEIEIEFESIILEDLELTKAILNTMVKNNVLEKKKIEVLQNRYTYKGEAKEKLKLNEEQQNAFNKITESISKNKFDEFLLFGVTGSGKTEVYMQVIEETIKNGKTAIMLVPEIGLTPQMEKVFSERFKDKISIMHSRLTKKERSDEWNNIKNGEKQIVIGTRSAVFAPLNNIGLIIIDEEHDMSYISGSNPRYDAKELARYIAKQNKGVLVLGSATPLVTSMYRAKTNKSKLLTMKKRVHEVKMPEVKIINMRTKTGYFSDELIKKLKENMEEEKQSLIFLNRRGYSSMLMCSSCGKTFMCPNCSVNLKYHKYEDILKCHYCGYTEKNPAKCPDCGGEIKNFGTGTEKIELELKKVFKDLLEKGEVKREITTARMDQDMVNKNGGHKYIIDEFVKKKRDVLIGTQMIAKGHHFKDVNMVAVLLADNLLNFESYLASEQSFQTLVQVIGRAGREENGIALIQTYNPDNYIIELAKNNDYLSFYNMELNIRKNLNYPPFMDLISFQILSDNIDKGYSVGKELEIKLKRYLNVLKQNLEKIFNKALDKSVVLNEIQKEEKRKEFKEYLNNIQLFDIQNYRINKLKNMYRLRIILKAKYNDIVMHWIKDILDSIKLPKGTAVNLIINNDIE